MKMSFDINPFMTKLFPVKVPQRVGIEYDFSINQRLYGRGEYLTSDSSIDFGQFGVDEDGLTITINIKPKMIDEV